MNNYIYAPMNGDVESTQSSCSPALTLKVTGIQNVPIENNTQLLDGTVLILNRLLNKWQYKTMPQIFIDNPNLITSIIEIATSTLLPTTLLPKTLYITTNNGEIFYNLGGVIKQLNKNVGITEFTTDTSIGGITTMTITGNDFITVAPVTNYISARIVNLPTIGVAKGSIVRFETMGLTQANIATFPYIVAVADFPTTGSSTTQLSPITTFEFAYTGTQWKRLK